MQLDIINQKGEKTGRTVELPDEIFAATPNDHIIYLAVKQYRAAQRQGTHKVKTRSEVKGASHKLHKQKGTGGSRKGNIRNPLYKGGGTIFGPKPHKYELKMNRKEKDLAKISALTYKAKDNAIVVLEDINLDTPKTKIFTGILKNLNANSKKTLFVIPEYDTNLCKSMRNVEGVTGTVLSDMNIFDILHSNILVMTESAAKMFSVPEGSEA